MQFKRLFEIQKEFTKRFFKEKHNMSLEDVYSDQATKVKWNKEYILSLSKEVYEMLDELDWKMHHRKDEEDVSIISCPEIPYEFDRVITGTGAVLGNIGTI